MASKKRTPGKKRPSQEKPDDATAWRIILENIQSQNRTTLDAVHTTHHRLSDQIREIREQSEARFNTLEQAVRGHSAELRGHSAEIRSHSAEIRGLRADVARIEAKVDKLVPLEERVAAIERRRA